MKKTISAFIAIALLGGTASAQNLQDAFNYTRHDYYGTARSIAMGNAMTAVGGDLGSVTLNPAGSAVSKFTQFTITPNISIGGTNSTYYSVAGGTAGTENRSSSTKMTLPNIGFTTYYNTGSSYGVKGWSFGFLVNQTSNHIENVFSYGKNEETSIAGALATATENAGYNSSTLSGDNAYYGSASWNSILAYQSGLISTYDNSTSKFIGATEKLFDDGNVRICGPLDQTFSKTVNGSNNDMVFNFGMNINDKFYVGANVGITINDYNMEQTVREYAVTSSDFEITFDDGGTASFDNLRHRYKFTQRASGAYFKLGGIFLPVKGLRIGAAIQGPTVLLIKERWRTYAETNFTSSSYDSWAETPEGSYTYRLRSPFRANAGIAYTAGKVFMVSADYEICNYKSMKFTEENGEESSSFINVNEDIKNFAGVQHQARFGVEVKPDPMFALRAGFTYENSPEYIVENYQKKNVKNPTKTYSLGAGYSSEGSFFADLSFRYMDLGKNYLQMYDDYLSDTYSPEILAKGFRYDITCTIGFRF